MRTMTATMLIGAILLLSQDHKAHSADKAKFGIAINKGFDLSNGETIGIRLQGSAILPAAPQGAQGCYWEVTIEFGDWYPTAGFVGNQMVCAGTWGVGGPINWETYLYAKSSTGTDIDWPPGSYTFRAWIVCWEPGAANPDLYTYVSDWFTVDIYPD